MRIRYVAVSFFQEKTTSADKIHAIEWKKHEWIDRSEARKKMSSFFSESISPERKYKKESINIDSKRQKK